MKSRRRKATAAFLAWREAVRDGSRLSFSEWWIESDHRYEANHRQCERSKAARAAATIHQFIPLPQLPLAA